MDINTANYNYLLISGDNFYLKKSKPSVQLGQRLLERFNIEKEKDTFIITGYEYDFQFSFNLLEVNEKNQVFVDGEYKTVDNESIKIKKYFLNIFKPSKYVKYYYLLKERKKFKLMTNKKINIYYEG